MIDCRRIISLIGKFLNNFVHLQRGNVQDVRRRRRRHRRRRQRRLRDPLRVKGNQTLPINFIGTFRQITVESFLTQTLRFWIRTISVLLPHMNNTTRFQTWRF